MGMSQPITGSKTGCYISNDWFRVNYYSVRKDNGTSILSWTPAAPELYDFYEKCRLCFSKQINKKTLFYSPRKRVRLSTRTLQKYPCLRIAKPMAVKRTTWTGVNFNKRN